LSEAIRTWQLNASSQPPPRAKPFTAAITGLPSVSMRLIASWPDTEYSLPAMGVSADSSLMSAPATNALGPAPVMINAWTPASPPAAATARSSSRTVRLSSALSLSGRLMMIVAILSSTS